ncbi:MAG: M14 family metallopeptidase [Phycisphaerae bacterium]
MTTKISTEFIIPLLIASILARQQAIGNPPRNLEGLLIVGVTVEDARDAIKLQEFLRTERMATLESEQLSLGIVDVRVNHEARKRLEETGLTVSTKIEDLQQHVRRLYATSAGNGFFDSHQPLASINAYIEYLHKTYPNFVEVFSMGQSVQGRELWTMKITAPGEKLKPAVLYHGSQHGNEQAGTIAVLLVATHLLENYGKDNESTLLLDNVTWYILPVMNPDGYIEYRRHNANDVDLNRNWGGPGAGESSLGGPFPFSEPETMALRDFITAHPEIMLHIDFHGYVDMLLWPWGHKREHCPDHDAHRELTEHSNVLLHERLGFSYRVGPVNSTLYYVPGGSIDYSYGVRGIAGFLWELHTSELPYIADAFLEPSLWMGMQVAEAAMNCEGDSPVAALGKPTDDFDCNRDGVPDSCELIVRDIDGDGLVNACDDDNDNDGITDDADSCPIWIVELPHGDNGIPLANTNLDCYIDRQDYQPFISCARHSGPGQKPSNPDCTTLFDMDNDGDIDISEFRRLQNAWSR